MTIKTRYSLLSAAVLMALGTSAQAQDATLDELVTPQKSISAGTGYLTDDNGYFGMYHGYVDSTEKGFLPLFSMDYNRRDEDSGAWWRARASVGSTGRYHGGGNWGATGLGVEYDRQGDWGASLEIDHHRKANPFTFNTGLTGIGTNDMVLNGTALRDVMLETERENVRLGLDKHLPEGFDLRFKFRNEEKEGERHWGYYLGSFQVGFVAEPIDYQTREYEAIVDYTGDRFQVSGGVYGSSFENAYKVVNVNDRGSDDTLSQPLDNDAWNFYATGGYQFTPTTRATFHASRGKQTQDENFFIPSEGNGRTSLDGEVETTLLSLGLYSRPMKGLSLSAKARYDKRDDETPVDSYVPSRGQDNAVWSREFTSIDLGAGYRLPMDFKLKGGYGYDKRERDIPPDPDQRSVTFREETEEDTYRVELHRMMSPSVNGRVVFQHQNRDGSVLFEDARPADPDRIAPRHWADRERDQFKAAVDWIVSDALSTQFRYEYSDTEYDPPGRDLGVRNGESQLISVDASYKLGFYWTLTGWVTLTQSEIDQSSVDRTSDEWDANLENTGVAAGLGLRGEPREDLKVGVDVKYTYDKSEHRIVDLDGADTLDNLPDIQYKLWSANFFAEHAVDRRLSVRFDVIYDKRATNDWTWQELNGDRWLYDDGSSVYQDQEQDVVFAGVSMRYAWH